MGLIALREFERECEWEAEWEADSEKTRAVRGSAVGVLSVYADTAPPRPPAVCGLGMVTCSGALPFPFPAHSERGRGGGRRRGMSGSSSELARMRALCLLASLLVGTVSGVR